MRRTELDLILESMTSEEIIYHLNECGMYDEVLTEGIKSSVNALLDLSKMASRRVRLSNAGVAAHKAKSSIKKELIHSFKNPVQATARAGIHTGGQAVGMTLPLHPIKGIAQSYRASRKFADATTKGLTAKVIKNQLVKAVKNSPAATKKAFLYSVKNGPNAFKKGVQKTPDALKYSAVKTKDGLKYAIDSVRKHPIETPFHIANATITPAPLLVAGAYGIRGTSKYLTANKGHVAKSAISDISTAKQRIKDYIQYMKSPSDIKDIPNDVWVKTGMTKKEITDYVKDQIKTKKNGK